MNERIHAKVMRGKLPDIKRPGSDKLDIRAIFRLERERKQRRGKWSRKRNV